VITGILWTVAIGFGAEVIARVATVLVIACPHALGLAVPLVVAITTAMGAGHGILVRDRAALERAREIDTIVFDKTGTLTQGEFGVVGTATANGVSQDEALALAAAVEADSEHTIAQGIRKTAEERSLSLPSVGAFETIKGRGVPTSLALADVLRPESKEAVRRLHEMGIQVMMLTGDSAAVAKAVADELGIDRYFAEVLPENKDAEVSELQAQGRRVAMVGDGVNDAPALTRADVGIAIGSRTDVAVESEGIVLVENNPLAVARVVELSRASHRKMVENLIWATGYNVVVLPLAAGVLAPIGILLSPAAGALMMSLSTVIVAINAQLLRRQRIAVA
jgi:Cu2+-exporting ATPase